MRSLAAILVAITAFAACPLAAQEIAYEPVEQERAVRLDSGSDRYFSAPPAQLPQGVAAYGPFRVLDGGRAALVDVTDTRTPGDFRAMLRDFPGIAVIEMIDCPGTEDDRANLRLGRMIRAAGIATHVPAGGSVRSGGVELFLAGISRRIDEGAEFAVHAWIDEDGLQADDYAATAEENAKYLVYYREMGMSRAQAAAFYAMTNSTPFEQARWLNAAEMRGWLEWRVPADQPQMAVTLLANLDLSQPLH